MKKVANIVATGTTGEGGLATGHRCAPTDDEIARLAFTLYELRGRRDGHDTEDWLRAEQELTQHHI